jgi:RNA polymerase sigma-70 factor (ECF subfamily)
MAESDLNAVSVGQDAAFFTTHLTVVLAARRNDSASADTALEGLCRTYWYPLYAFTRRRGYPPHEAQDLTQEFFARLLASTLTRPSHFSARPWI